MVCVAAKKVKVDFRGYRWGDKSNRAGDKGIAANEPETQHEEYQSSEGGFSNVVGYSDL